MMLTGIRIFTKFGVGVGVADVITSNIFWRSTYPFGTVISAVLGFSPCPSTDHRPLTVECFLTDYAFELAGPPDDPGLTVK